MMQVFVTQQHIEEAPKIASQCAVCLAIRETFAWLKEKSFEIIRLPLECYQWQARFVAGEPVEPFSFNIDEKNIVIVGDQSASNV